MENHFVFFFIHFEYATHGNVNKWWT
jgi:hypothetical protein